MATPRTKTVVIGFLLLLLSFLRVNGAIVYLHYWAFKGPGGYYGITEQPNGWHDPRMTNTVTMFHLGPLGAHWIPVSAPTVAVGLLGITITLIGLASIALSKRGHEGRRP